MAIPVAAIAAGVGVAKQLFGGGKRPNNRKAIARLRAAKPQGYLTAADRRAAELTRGRLSEGVQAQGRLAGYEISRRAQARGIGGPSEERSQARLNQQVLLGQQHAGESAEEQLYNVSQGREAFERQKELEIFGAETGETAREAERYQAEQGGFWNSINEFIPSIMSGINTGSTLPGYQASIDNPDLNIPGFDAIRPLGNTSYRPGGD